MPGAVSPLLSALHRDILYLPKFLTKLTLFTCFELGY
jgi:hypothetical protein